MNGSTFIAVQRTKNHPSLCETIAIRLVRMAAALSPGYLSKRLGEEWLACLADLDGASARLRFALGCLWAAPMIHQAPAAVAALQPNPLRSDLRLIAGGPSGGARWSPARSTAGEAVICNINTTPLIDVMLVLLVTLIVSLPHMTHAVKLAMPGVSTTQPLTPPEIISLDIDFDGTLVWNGTTVAGLQALEGYFQTEASKQTVPQINLHPDRRAPYDIVAKVLAAAQRNGMTNISFANTAEFR